MAGAILIATAGVVIMALKPGTRLDVRATLLGLAAGAMLALSAVGYRGAILSLGLPNYVVAATFTLVVGLVGQSVVLSLYLWLRDPEVLAAIVRDWRPSLVAGFMGALASQFWFLAFALATAASVRTLALVEVLFAQAISHFIFKQPTTPREGVGIVLIVLGVALLAVGVLRRGGRLIALVGQHRQRMKLDAFLVQLLGILRRGLAVDRAVLDLAVVHLARLLGKFLPDIVGVLGQVLAQLLELLAELALLRRHHGDRRGRIGRGARLPEPAPRPAPQCVGADILPRFFVPESRGAISAFSTLAEPQCGQVTRPRLACLS